MANRRKSSVVVSAFSRVLREPPMRLLTKAIVSSLPFSARTKAFWDAVSRPQYLVGVLTAADQAVSQGIEEISVFEFGVARGDGLLVLADYAARVEKRRGLESGSTDSIPAMGFRPFAVITATTLICGNRVSFR